MIAKLYYMVLGFFVGAKMSDINCRRKYILKSNNPRNPAKNWCALAVCKELRVHNKVLFLHTLDDIFKAVSTKYAIRRVTIDKHTRMLSLFRQLYHHHHEVKYIILTKGHVLLTNNYMVLIDTAPKGPSYYDKRKVIGVYALLK